jgi:glycosyltransferase involved in cell wall biosynthesis
MKRVCYIFPVSHHYRRPFHEKLREILRQSGVDYTVIYCDPLEENRKKKDTVEIDWGIKVPLSVVKGGLWYQHALRASKGFDLAIVQQENKLLLNYILILLRGLRRQKIGYFGHGRNFQSRNPDGIGERFKRFWATKTDWWFGYTDETRRHIETLGYPANQISVFNNSVDTTQLRQQVAAVDEDRLAGLRRQFGIGSGPLGVFVGGIYPDKRMEFLVESADRIRSRVPDFECVIIGGGSDLPLIQSLAETRPWIHVLGPRFGQEKVDLMCMGHVFLMPGLMGLAILDAGVTGLPIATTAFPWHSPEIAYLEPGVNGLLVQDWKNPLAYGDAVADLLLEPERRSRMADEARAMADRYSIEQMAQRFATGVLKALET